MRPLTTADMFTRPLLPALRETLDVVTNDDTVSGEDRPSKKVNLHNTIKCAARILKGMYAEAMEDDKVKEMDNFMEAYNFRVPEILAEAQYKVIKKSMDKTRRPAALLDEADVTKLKDFVTCRLKKLTAETCLSSQNYSLLCPMYQSLYNVVSR